MLSTYHITGGQAGIGRHGAMNDAAVGAGLPDLDADELWSSAPDAGEFPRLAITARFADRFDITFGEHVGGRGSSAAPSGRLTLVPMTTAPGVSPQPVIAPPASEADARPAPRRRCSPLPTWRLKRTLTYIETHLDGAVSLADLAAAAGLTRMHFAAQFRVATGLRPHEFLLRRRIERAQELLASPNQTLVDVALSVGFQTQAHFTTVFKRFVGETPHRWRRANAA